MTERERWIERGRRERERKLGPPPQVGPAPRPRHASDCLMCGRAGGQQCADWQRCDRHQAKRSDPLDAAVDRHPSNRRRRVATTVADLAPVVVPEPGTVIPFRPQPARTSGAGTQTMTRLTDTGELRAAADRWIDQMRAEDVAWRAKEGLI